MVDGDPVAVSGELGKLYETSAQSIAAYTAR